MASEVDNPAARGAAVVHEGDVLLDGHVVGEVGGGRASGYDVIFFLLQTIRQGVEDGRRMCRNVEEICEQEAGALLT
jgi:hypothetical protein